MSGLHVPQPHRVVVTAGQGFSVRREGNGPDPLGQSIPRMPFQDSLGLRSSRVPQPDGAVPAAACQGFSVRGEGHRLDPAGVSFKDSLRLPRARIPQPDRMVPAGTGQGSAVRGERQGLDLSGVPVQGGFQPAGSGLPQPDRPVSAAACQGPAVRREGHGTDKPLVTLQSGFQPSAPDRPKLDFPAAAGRQGPAVRRERHRSDEPRSQAGFEPAGAGVVEPGSDAAGRRQPGAVGGTGDFAGQYRFPKADPGASGQQQAGIITGQAVPHEHAGEQQEGEVGQPGRFHPVRLWEYDTIDIPTSIKPDARGWKCPVWDNS